jgi:hypothetical protein
MLALHEVQSTLLHALMRRSAGEAAHMLLRSGRPCAQQRLQIYRNNLFESRIAALAAVYPVVEQLVGVEFFRCATRAYSQLFPMRYGNLHDFGDRMPEFLREYAPAAGLPYLADVARLEWACHHAYHQAQLPALDPVLLAQVAPDAQPGLRLRMQPSAALIRSAYPILRIWQSNQPEAGDTRCAISLDEGGVDLLVAQRNLQIELRRLDNDESRWLFALAMGDTLESATSRALEVNPDFDLAAALSGHLARGLFVGLA